MTVYGQVSLLSLHYPPEPTGNAPYAGSLAAGLVERGYRVAAHVGHPHYPEWSFREGYGQWTARETLHGVEVVRRRHYVPTPPRGLRRLVSEVTFGLRLLGAGIPDDSTIIALSPSMFSTAVATAWLRITRRKKRPPIIAWIQDLYTLGITETGQSSGLTAKIIRHVESRTLRAADQLVVIHPTFREYVINEMGVDPRRVAVIRNWTHLPPTALISKEAARAALGWDTTRRIVLHAGNMGAKQGLENVIEAARLADVSDANMEFVLLGDGAERTKLVELGHGVERLSFRPTLSEAEFRYALAAADILLVNERVGVSSMAVPSKLTSYFDAARPVVAATDLNGITAGEIKLAEAGKVTPAGDPAALLRALDDVLSLSDAGMALGANGRRFREKTLDRDRAMEEWNGLIRDVRERHRSGSHSAGLRTNAV